MFPLKTESANFISFCWLSRDIGHKNLKIMILQQKVLDSPTSTSKSHWETSRRKFPLKSLPKTPGSTLCWTSAIFPPIKFCPTMARFGGIWCKFWSKIDPILSHGWVCCFKIAIVKRWKVWLAGSMKILRECRWKELYKRLQACNFPKIFPTDQIPHFGISKSTDQKCHRNHGQGFAHESSQGLR